MLFDLRRHIEPFRFCGFTATAFITGHGLRWPIRLQQVRPASCGLRVRPNKNGRVRHWSRSRAAGTARGGPRRSPSPNHIQLAVAVLFCSLLFETPLVWPLGELDLIRASCRSEKLISGGHTSNAVAACVPDLLARLDAGPTLILASSRRSSSVSCQSSHWLQSCQKTSCNLICFGPP
jgi:hypothetical protein